MLIGTWRGQLKRLESEHEQPELQRREHRKRTPRPTPSAAAGADANTPCTNGGSSDIAVGPGAPRQRSASSEGPLVSNLKVGLTSTRRKFQGDIRVRAAHAQVFHVACASGWRNYPHPLKGSPGVHPAEATAGTSASTSKAWSDEHMRRPLARRPPRQPSRAGGSTPLPTTSKSLRARRPAPGPPSVERAHAHRLLAWS